MKTDPLALDAYIRAWEIWNMIVPTSTRWDELKESHRLRWIKALDSLAPAAKEDGIPEEIRPAYIDCCRGSAPAHECYINCGGTKPNPTRDRDFAPQKVMREFLSVCESECNHPYCWSQKPVASLQEPEGEPTEQERNTFVLEAIDAARARFPELNRMRELHDNFGNILLYSGMVADYALRKLRSQESK